VWIFAGARQRLSRLRMLQRNASSVSRSCPVRVMRPCNGSFHVIASAEIVSWAQQRERECCLLVLNLVSSTLPCIRQPRPRLSPSRLRQARTHPRLSSSTELSAVNQRLLLRTLPVQEQAGTLWLPFRSERSFFATWQDLGLSPMDRLRSEVVGRLLRTPCARVFPRLLARRRQVVVVRRAPAKQAGPLWLALRRPLCSVRAASQAT
jgi:hypothetical protein